MELERLGCAIIRSILSDPNAFGEVWDAVAPHGQAGVSYVMG